MTITDSGIWGYEIDETDNWNSVNIYYLSGTKPSTQGNYGLVTTNYHPFRKFTNLTGATSYQGGVTGSAVYSAPYKTKTIYISAGNFTGTIAATAGMAFNIEGSHTDSQYDDWYVIWESDIYDDGKYYYSFEEHHPYIRTRISGLSTGASGNFMAIVCVQG